MLNRAAGIVTAIFAGSFGCAAFADLPEFRVCTTSGVLFDLNTQTGAAESPRGTSLGHVVDVETDAAGGLFMLTSYVGTDPNSLYAIDSLSGAATLIGSTGLSAIYEGDLALNPADGYFYGIQNVPQGTRRFFRIDPDTGHGIELANLGPVGDFSGLTYAMDNRLFSLDVARDLVFELNPTTGTIVDSVPLTATIDSDVCGMDYDPVTDTIYVAGRSAGIEGLFALDPENGQLTLVGQTGVSGISGLAVVPEPGTLICMLAIGIGLSGHARRVRISQ